MRHENARSSSLTISRRSMMIGVSTAMAAPTFFGLRCASAEAIGCGIPIDLADGWRTAMPASVGIDGTRLCALTDWLDKFGATNVHSVLVIRNGVLAFEHYRNGNDEIWDKSAPNAEHGPAVKHDMRSVSKSVTSLLVGIALDRKLIPSIDEPIFNYFPEYADLRTPEKVRITLRHLLMMASGLQWDENAPYTSLNNSEVAMWRSADRLRFALQPRLLDEPGSVWNYSGGCTELLGAIVRKAAGKPIETFADEVLFAPLGISDWSWVRYPDKIPAAASGLQMRSRDLAKIGQLILKRGHFGDKQIVSELWISASTSPQIGPEDRTYFYGYQWWLARSLINRREVAWVAGMGLGGQRLFIVPALDLVCVVTAGHYTDAMQNWLPLLIFNRFVMPAVV